MIAANVSKQLEEAQRLYKKILKDTDTKLKNMLADVNLSETERLQAGNSAGEVIEKARLENLNTQIKAYSKQKARLEREIAEKQKELLEEQSLGGKEELRIEVEGKIAALQELIDKIEELKNPEKPFSLADTLLNGKGSDGDNDIKSTMKVVDSELNRLNGKLAEFENRANKSGGSFDSFLASLGEMASNEKIAPKLDEIKLKMEQVFANESFVKTEKSFDKFITKLGRVEEASRAAFAEKTSDSLSISTKNATKYQIAMKGLIADIEKYIGVKDAKRAADMVQQVIDGQSIAQMQDMSAIYSEITNKNLKLEEQLGKQSEGQGAYYDGLIFNAERILNTLDKETEGYDKTSDALLTYIENLKQMKAIKNGETKNALMDHIKEWDNLETAIVDVQTNALDGFVDVFTNGLTGASSGFKEFADAVIKDITRMIVKFMVMKAITGAMGMWKSAGVDSTYAQGMGTNSDGGYTTFGGHLEPFANGGIMTSAGSLPLNKYANGGIASSPQLALFGEGRMNEAYVPLPDGRTIPVTMKGGAGDVQVNIFNQGGQRMEGESNTRFDGEKMVVDVMLKHINQPGRVRESIKGV